MTENDTDRIAALRDERSDLRAAFVKASHRMAYAELDKDRRQWTQEERDELLAAEVCFDVALDALERFCEINAADLGSTA